MPVVRQAGGQPSGQPDGQPGDPAAGPADGPEQAPVAPFTQRVLVLVEIVAEPSEIALARALLAERGWPVREAAPDETPPPPEPSPGSDPEPAGAAARPRHHLVVEVRLNGARWRAERAAVSAVESLARRHKLALWVRDAAVVTPPREHRATYRVVRRPDGRLLRLVAWLTGLGAHRLLRLPAALTREDVERELRHRRLGGIRFAADHRLVPPPPADEAEAARRSPDGVPRPLVVLGAVGLVAAVAWGYGLWWAEGPALVVPLAMLALTGAAFAAFPWREPLPRAVRLAAGPTLVACCAAMGGLLAAAGADRDSSPGQDLQLFAAALVVLFVLPGVYLALRQTWLSRNAVWLVPLAVPVAGSTVAWLGRLMRAVYLEEFDVPAGSVRSVESVWDYAAAAKPLGTAVCFVLLFTGLLGWARHTYLALGGGRVYAVVATLVASLLYVLVGIGVGVDAARADARRAMADARAGRTPAAYFGLQGSLLCVRPVDGDGGAVAVENGPVPTGHPVLSFGSSEEWIWLWDPRRDGAGSPTVAVRREDVRLIPPGAAGGCRQASS